MRVRERERERYVGDGGRQRETDGYESVRCCTYLAVFIIFQPMKRLGAPRGTVEGG